MNIDAITIGSVNIDNQYNQICQYGAIETEVHVVLKCSSTYTSRQILITNVSEILVQENILSDSEFITLNRTELIKKLLFGHPELSKKSVLMPV